MIASPVRSGSLSWFARHEFNLAWRDFVRMLSGGRPGRERRAFILIVIAALLMHLIAFAVLSPALSGDLEINKRLYTVLSGTLLLSFSLMLSQGMELVTRVFYSRSDLDLILSSPASQRRLFTVRVGAIAGSITLLSLLIAGSAINVMAVFSDLRWLLAYPVIIACGLMATALSLALTVGMFRLFGPAKTRLAAQIVAALVGASFVIGIQIAAISSMGSYSRFEFLKSDLLATALPAADHFIWLPARAITGEAGPLMFIVGASAAALALAIFMFADRFGPLVISAAGTTQTTSRQHNGPSVFRRLSVSQALRRKEWKLLARDHWLISQTLMQILYLLPPAFMLWHGFGNIDIIGVVLVPVLVMASGQLAGGLAWLAISGEDAPDLIGTAPVPPSLLVKAKIEAVLITIVAVVSPFIIAIAFASLKTALLAAAGIAIAAASATWIQLLFKSQSKRTSFRRRQTASKVATLTEAFSSILWAGTVALAATGTWFWVATLAMALGVLWISYCLRPERE